MQKASESLAGRAVHLVLQPMTRLEQAGRAAAGRWSVFFEAEAGAWPQSLDEDGRRVDWRPLARMGS